MKSDAMSRELKDALYVLVILGGILLIVMLAGCKSLSGNLNIDTPFMDIEYEGTSK